MRLKYPTGLRNNDGETVPESSRRQIPPSHLSFVPVSFSLTNVCQWLIIRVFIARSRMYGSYPPTMMSKCSLQKLLWYEEGPRPTQTDEVSRASFGLFFPVSKQLFLRGSSWRRDSSHETRYSSQWELVLALTILGCHCTPWKVEGNMQINGSWTSLVYVKARKRWQRKTRFACQGSGSCLKRLIDWIFSCIHRLANFISGKRLFIVFGVHFQKNPSEVIFDHSIYAISNASATQTFLQMSFVLW